MTATPSDIAREKVRHASTRDERREPRFTIASLVTDAVQHAAMMASFQALGFSAGDCEFLFIDNRTAPQADAFHGLNAILNAARAPYVILCHQDVRLLRDGRAELERTLAALSDRDPHWAVAGNAGGVAPGQLALRISDPHGRDRHIGNLPERVMSLDENFIVVRRDARVGFSNDLAGFHFYGTDICLHALQMGYAAYVIDFHLEHLSPGNKSADFFAAERAFQQKWSRALSGRWLQTTCALVHVSGAPLSGWIHRWLAAPFAKLARRLPQARGFSRPSTLPHAG